MKGFNTRDEECKNKGEKKEGQIFIAIAFPVPHATSVAKKSYSANPIAGTG